MASCDDTVVGVETVSSFPIFGVDAVDFGVVEAAARTAVTNSAPKAALGGSWRQLAGDTKSGKKMAPAFATR